ncbi:hypothetical protein KUV85_12785 [Nocardioides panacisoli]|uniref:hypothetical protein n=1 Tax=Nocardioides panacisoli TaxID=627624 RepID=UPI001C6251EA|nr:hypothetical protein [Nocardioides panacisoli]QYJ03207.1 hypothetical protein KUV85_12785 [Nocardioides panacisoli]
MGWTDTRRRWQVLREVEAELADGATTLPWHEEYAALFGDRDGLLAMLRYRERLSYDAQVDPTLTEPVLEEQRRRLDRRFAGVRRLLAGTRGGGADVAA